MHRVKNAVVVGIIATVLTAPGFARAYGYGGHHWDYGSPTTVPVTIQFSVPGGWVNAIAAGMNTWNNAGARFRFNAGGADHNVAYKNVWLYPSALAVTYVREIFGSRITDRDTDISSRYPWSTTLAPGTYDVQNVMTHELGHWLMLDDLYGSGDYWKTMYGQASNNETYKRSLDTDDTNGIRAIYGT